MGRRETARQLIFDILRIDLALEIHIRESSRLVDDLSLDSIQMIQFVMRIDWHLDTDIPDEEAEAIVTVSDAIELVLRTSSRERFALRTDPRPDQLPSFRAP